jgi:hypothetical protein
MEKALTTKKKNVISYDDDPKVGQLWKRLDNNYGVWDYYILIEAENTSNPPWDSTFRMLEVRTGNVEWRYMNFELDEWRLVHET